MKIIFIVALSGILSFSAAHAQSARPMLPIPAPDDAFTPVITPLPNLLEMGYCIRFFVQKQGMQYVCINVMDPKDYLTIDEKSDLYKKIQNMQLGTVLAKNPQTKQVNVIKPVFNMIDIRKYADAALLVLEDASDGIVEAKKYLKEEGSWLLKLNPIGINTIMNNLNKEIINATNAMNKILDIPPRLPGEKERALKELKNLERSIRAALKIINDAIEKMENIKNLLKQIHQFEDFMTTLDEAIEFAKELRKQMEEEAKNIRMFWTLHAPDRDLKELQKL